jgi:hypothetical protein
MLLRRTALLVLAATASLSVACGGSDKAGKSVGPDTGTGGSSSYGTDAGGGCAAGTALIGGKCVADKGALPCTTALNTGFPGDTQCLEPPDPSEGMQMHYGPTNYDDPTEMANFTIHPSDEVVDCMFMKTPTDHNIHMNDYHARLRPGTHHMITYVQQQDHADSVLPEPCNQGPGFVFLVGATSINTDISTTGEGSPAEYSGAAMEVTAKSQAAVQMHFINTSEEDHLKEGWVNAMYYPDDQVKMEVNPITWLGGLGMDIKPGTSVTTEAGGASCTVPAGSPDLDIITTVAHMHSHTTRLAAFIQRAGSTDREKIYEDYNWEEPTFLYYTSTAVNSPPDPVAKKTGGISGDLVAHPGDQLSWECEVHNDGPNDNLELKFSDKALTGEMCNVFGVYGPATTPWSCYSL